MWWSPSWPPSFAPTFQIPKIGAVQPSKVYLTHCLAAFFWSRSPFKLLPPKAQWEGSPRSQQLWPMCGPVWVSPHKVSHFLSFCLSPTYTLRLWNVSLPMMVQVRKGKVPDLSIMNVYFFLRGYHNWWETGSVLSPRLLCYFWILAKTKQAHKVTIPAPTDQAKERKKEATEHFIRSYDYGLSQPWLIEGSRGWDRG